MDFISYLAFTLNFTEMLMYDADNSWREYYEYLVDLFWKGYINEDDWDLSKKHGRLYKDGKPYTKSNTMESVKVTPPEGYEIDKEKSTTSEIFFRKKDGRPRKWSDLNRLEGWWIDGNSYIKPADCRANDSKDKNVWPTKELAEAALALSELMQYRQRWIGDWKPDWCNSDPKYCLIFKRDLLDYECLLKTSHPLSFPTKEMIHDFTTTFRNLLETAKPLL